MPLDPAIVKSQFKAVLTTDAAGAAVRSLLGSATSIIDAEDLRKPLPVEPFIVLRAGSIGGDRDDVRPCVLTWWIYDTVPRRFTRINPIVAAIQAAYRPYTFAIGKLTISGISQEIAEDAALDKRPSRSIQYTYTRRG